MIYFFHYFSSDILGALFFCNFAVYGRLLSSLEVFISLTSCPSGVVYPPPSSWLLCMWCMLWEHYIKVVSNVCTLS